MISDSLFDQIEAEIFRSGKDSRYKLSAYVLILSSLDYSRSKCEESDDLSASEIVDAVSELAIMKYGPMALEVVEGWGIFSARDVGNIVYNLIDIDILKRDEKDSLDDFMTANALFDSCKPSLSLIILMMLSLYH